jgi:hypothetical protein
MEQRTRSMSTAARRAHLAVIVREGLKGNHLLFAPLDLAGCGDAPAAQPPEVAREVSGAGAAIARAASIDEARAVIAACSAECRKELARLYLGFLGRCVAVQGHAS